MYVGIKCVHQLNKSHHCLDGSCLVSEFMLKSQCAKDKVNSLRTDMHN
jgi:hypothetical protein